MKTALITLALCATPISVAFAQACSKQSPAHTVALLELYTSEGCSSCPPADRSLSKLRDSAASGTLGINQLVPLAMHVDYWDYIGWKDVFASKVYTARQRWLSELANTRTIYTPEMFAGGLELRNWSDGLPAAVRRINSQPAKADIAISLGTLTAGSLPVSVNAKAAQGGELFVALYENGLATQVKAGENSGVTLRHDYVVRQWVGPIKLDATAGAGKATTFMKTLALPTGAAAKNLGVAAVVQSDKGEVLQALALPFCSA